METTLGCKRSLAVRIGGRPVAVGGGGLLSHRPAVYSLAFLLLLIVITTLAPLFTPYGRDDIDLDRILAGPSPRHPLGTDELGRDLFTRLLYGGRVSLLVALCSVLVATVLGLLMGSAAGYFGGAVDQAVNAGIDLFMSIPVFLVLMLVSSLGGGLLWLMPLIIGGTSWMETARVTRTRLMSLRAEPYVEAARTIGSSDLALLARHLVPATAGQTAVAATVGFAQAMLVESALSFLGFGVQPPAPTWGNMLQNANLLFRRAPVAAFAPGLLIFMTCLCFYFLGDGLRRVLEKKPVT